MDDPITQGPWWIHKLNDGTPIVTSRSGDIARFPYNLGTGMCMKANARLMAAAPELLVALKACQLQMLQSNNQSEYAEEANELARAAISKAEVPHVR